MAYMETPQLSQAHVHTHARVHTHTHQSPILTLTLDEVIDELHTTASLPPPPQKKILGAIG